MKPTADSDRLSMQLIHEAHARIRPMINRTPVMTSSTLDSYAGAQLFFKCENFQKVGAFKARGATNAVFCLSDADAARGVVTHSSGNHAAALARAARLRGIQAFVVMPRTAPKAKQESVRRYGGKIILSEPDLAAREDTARSVVLETGGILIHAFDDLNVMAGQGTAAVELLEDVPNLDYILSCVGGGGHLSGIAAASKAMNPQIRVLGVEPAGADDASRSLKAGHLIPSVNPNTIADGLMTSLSARTFAEICRHVDDIVTVSEQEIIRSMRLIWEVMKVIVEPSGAVAYAAVARGRPEARGKRVGVVLSGGNLDLDRLPWSNAD